MPVPDFSLFDQGTTGAWTERLSWRYTHLLLPHAEKFTRRTVVDLGCHDGRWMHFALCLGAGHVTGIDARADNLERCAENLSRAGHDCSRYEIRQGDVEDAAVTHNIEGNIVLAFGLLYHLLSPLDLLRRLCARRPQTLLIDTAITSDATPLLRLYEENPLLAGNAPANAGNRAALICHPSESALALTLANSGYRAEVHRWGPSAPYDTDIPGRVIPSPAHPLIDYQSGRRILIVASPAFP